MNIEPAMMGHALSRPSEAILGVGYELLINAEATGGQYELMKFVVPKGLGPPLHMHTKEDECFVVIDGEFEVTIGEQQEMARRGDFIHLPRNLPHAIRNLDDDPGTFLCWVTPGNLGTFFDTFKKPWPANEKYPPLLTGADIQSMMDVAHDYGIKVLTTG